MSNPRRILRTVDQHLTLPAEITLFGRSALALGYSPTPAHFQLLCLGGQVNLDLPASTPRASTVAPGLGYGGWFICEPSSRGPEASPSTSESPPSRPGIQREGAIGVPEKRKFPGRMAGSLGRFGPLPGVEGDP